MSEFSKDNNQNSPVVISAREKEGFLVPNLPEHFFRKNRAPSVSQNLLNEIVKSPESYGSTAIFEAIDYLQPELSYVRGMIRVEHQRFYEQSEDGPWENCFDFSFARSFHDSAVITDVRLKLLGVKMDFSEVLTDDLLNLLPQIGDIERFKKPKLVLQDGGLLALDSSVFRHANLRLSIPNDNLGFYECVGVVGQERVRKKDGLVYLSVKTIGASSFPSHEDLIGNEQSVQINRFASYYGKVGYTAIAAKRRLSRDTVVLTLNNTGPAEFWINVEMNDPKKSA